MALPLSEGRILVIDVGSSRVRAGIVAGDGGIRNSRQAMLLTEHRGGGFLEFDAAAMVATAVELAEAVISDVGSVDAVGITAQRASTIVWNRRNGQPIAPAIGWQDLRTTGMCLGLQSKGLRLSPNQSATKLAYLLQLHSDLAQSDLCFGTVETFVAWKLSQGAVHCSDRTSAAVTGLLRVDATTWDDRMLELLGIDESLLPRLIPTSGVCGTASALLGAPPIASLCGDQQASLIGQGCIHPGTTKATFGTGAMVDCCLGENRPTFVHRGEAGTFPIVAWEDLAGVHWGLEAIMLSAGSCVEWLCSGLHMINSPAASDELAGSVPDSGGVTLVPALAGTGTPSWDFGARGVLLGLSAATSRAEVVHAVLDGIAQSGADLLEAIEHDAGIIVDQLCIDGGMIANSTFLSLLANAIQRPVAVSPTSEATTRGAGFLAGTPVGTWSSLQEAVSIAAPPRIVEPTRHPDRERWKSLSVRALETVPALSAIKF